MQTHGEAVTRSHARELPRRVRHVMTKKVTTVAPDDELALALQMMLWSSIRHLPVVDEGKLVGLVSDHDLLVHRRDGHVDGHLRTRVGEVMHRPVKTVHPDEDLRAAAALMAAARVRCLPVVIGDALVGILTSSDILAEHGRPYFETQRGPRVSDVMTRTPFSYRADTRLFDVVLTMVREGVRHLPVLDEQRRVVGIITDRDIRVVLGDPVHALARSDDFDLDDLTAAHAMTPRPVLVSENASLGDLARTLLDEEVGAVPVVDSERKLVGVASYVDLLRFVFGA
jgi:CBS domain-containing protein